MIAVLSFHDYTVPKEHVLALVREAAEALRQPLRKPIASEVVGNPRRCFETVLKAVDAYGGSLVSGWSVVEVEPRIPQTGEFSRLVLNAHAMWQREGEWYETIPERYNQVGFIPAALPTPNAYMELFDDMASVKKAKLPNYTFDDRPYTHFYVSTSDYSFCRMPDDSRGIGDTKAKRKAKKAERKRKGK